jgi:hypothetical protein
VSRFPVLVLWAAATASALAQDPLSVPFTPAERWAQYLHRTYSPARMGRLAAETMLDQVLREPACWDHSALSYANRFGRSFERRVVRNTVELAGGILTGEDLRYRRARSRAFPARVWNAVLGSATARMPDGSIRPAYTRFVSGAVAEMSTAHWTRRRIQPEWLMRSAVWSTFDQVQTNLLDEFGPDLRRFGTKLWKRTRPFGR